MTEPTDKELDALILQHWPAAATATLPLRWIRAAFREGLAKWGTPPITYMRPSPTLGVAPFGHGTSAALAPITQAQAGAVPLTPEQVAEIADASHREYERLVASGQCAPRWSAVFAHLLEQHHGIKGGQHGADT